jgi:hypothetical protein
MLRVLKFTAKVSIRWLIQAVDARTGGFDGF